MQKDFFKVLSPQEFFNQLLTFPCLKSETISIDYTGNTGNTSEKSLNPSGNQAHTLTGLTIATNVISPEALPATHRSSMDGFAVQAADLYGATESNPTYLEHCGNVDIEHAPDFSVTAGNCATIVTGAIVPDGADAVVMIEHTAELGAGSIEFRKPVAPYENMLLQGEDVKKDSLALAKGTVLRAQEIGLLAALGIKNIDVIKKPTVAVLSTGSELVPSTTHVATGQIRDVNSHTIASLLGKYNYIPLLLGIVPDSLEAIETSIRTALKQSDVVLLSGGSSMGVRDYTVAAIDNIEGAKILAHGVALSPGKPTILAEVMYNGQKKAIWGLPGQVTSAQVIMHAFVLPFLGYISGKHKTLPPQHIHALHCKLSRNIASKQGREDWVRVKVSKNEHNEWIATPVLGKSGLLRTLLDADGFMPIPAQLEGFEKDTWVTVLPLL